MDERRDPERSARAAARYLKQLFEQTGDWRLAWAGYNAGVRPDLQGAEERASTTSGRWPPSPGSKVLRAETKGYVPKLMAAAIISKHPEAFGFTDEEIETHTWTEYEEVNDPLGDAALRRRQRRRRHRARPHRPQPRAAPRLHAAAPLRAQDPEGPGREAFAASWPSMQPKLRLTFAGHVVRKGDTLSGIAHRHGVPMQGIVEMNGLKRAKKLRVGQELMIPRPIGSGRRRRRRRSRPAGGARPARARRARRSRVPADRPRATHRVRAGDTLWSISQRFGVGLDELCRWNGIQNPNGHKLLVGAKLVVYAADRG